MTTMNISNNTIKALTKVIAYNKPFFADEVKLNGGTISALKTYGFIKATGKTKKVIVDLYDDYCKKVEVSQWVIDNKGIERAKREITKRMEEMTKFLEVVG